MNVHEYGAWHAACIAGDPIDYVVKKFNDFPAAVQRIISGDDLLDRPNFSYAVRFNGYSHSLDGPANKDLLGGHIEELYCLYGVPIFDIDNYWYLANLIKNNEPLDNLVIDFSRTREYGTSFSWTAYAKNNEATDNSPLEWHTSAYIGDERSVSRKLGKKLLLDQVKLINGRLFIPGISNTDDVWLTYDDLLKLE